MTEEEERTQVVRHWWSRAEESLKAAQRELEAESYSFAVNRIYYAAFYGASAALLERGLSFKRHSDLMCN
jgi:uncharacterized protein (UPF0332 family)